MEHCEYCDIFGDCSEGFEPTCLDEFGYEETRTDINTLDTMCGVVGEFMYDADIDDEEQEIKDAIEVLQMAITNFQMKQKWI